MSRVQYLLDFQIDLTKSVPALAALSASLALFGVPAEHHPRVDSDPLTLSLTVERDLTADEQKTIGALVETQLVAHLPDYSPKLCAFRFNGGAKAA